MLLFEAPIPMAGGGEGVLEGPEMKSWSQRAASWALPALLPDAPPHMGDTACWSLPHAGWGPALSPLAVTGRAQWLLWGLLRTAIFTHSQAPTHIHTFSLSSHVFTHTHTPPAKM